MLIKVMSSLIMLFVVYMGFKQGWGMVSTKPDLLEMFSKWDFNKTGIITFGTITLLSAVLILFPQTFVGGNFLMAATILLIICLQLSVKDLKGAAIELPFLLLNLLLIYFQYPFLKQK